MQEHIEIIKIIFGGTLTLVSVLVATLGFVISHYSQMKGLPSEKLNPYEQLSILILIFLAIGAVTSLSSLAYLLLNSGNENFFWFIIGLLFLLLIGVVIGAIAILVETFKYVKN